MHSMRHERALAVDRAVLRLHMCFAALCMDGGSSGLATVDHGVLQEHACPLIRLEGEVVITCRSIASSKVEFTCTICSVFCALICRTVLMLDWVSDPDMHCNDDKALCFEACAVSSRERFEVGGDRRAFFHIHSKGRR